jgi:hypothetical protein
MKKLIVLVLMTIFLCGLVAGAYGGESPKLTTTNTKKADIGSIKAKAGNNNASETEEGESNESADDSGKVSILPVKGPIKATIKLRKSLTRGNASPVSIATRQMIIAKLHERINLTKTQLIKLKTIERIKKQNLVRERVKALIELRNITRNETIGLQIAQVARELDNSINKTAQAELKIARRNALVRFFFGGSVAQAKIIDKEVSLNKARLARLKLLRNQSDNETRQFIAEQIQQLDLEQTRLKNLAEKEKKRRGIFGWLFRR